MISDSKPNKQYASPSEWESHKATIKKLYLDEARTLPEVRTVMEKEYGFYATVNMYKKRLRAWQFSKNIQESDARMALQRTAESGALGMFPFNVGGQPLGGKRLLRYLQRRPHLLFQTSTGEPLPKNAALAAELMRKQPSLQSISLSNEFNNFNHGTGTVGVLDTCLRPLQNFVRGTVILMNSQPDEWRHIYLGRNTSDRKKLVFEKDTDLMAICDTFVYVADALNAGSHPSITQLLHPEFDRLKNVLKQQNPDLIFACLNLCWSLNKRNRPELVNILNTYILQLSSIMLNDRHPVYVMWGYLSRLDKDEFNQLAERLQLASECELVNALGLNKKFPNMVKDMTYASNSTGISKFVSDRLARWIELHLKWRTYQPEEVMANFDHALADKFSNAIQKFITGNRAQAEEDVQAIYETDFDTRIWGNATLFYWLIAACGLSRAATGDIEIAEGHFHMGLDVVQRLGATAYQELAMLSLRGLAASPKVEEESDESDESEDKFLFLEQRHKRASV